jgi:RimJ/RimL family protein N-acetyltransferase
MTPYDAPAPLVAETARLRLRRFEPADAAFALELVNAPSWIRFIGKRDVPDLDAARAYLERGPIAMYAKHGFGLWCVALRATGEAIGMCGLIKRDTLPDVDLGFAFLPRHWGRGYALEAAEATMAYARETLGLRASSRSCRRTTSARPGCWSSSASSPKARSRCRGMPRSSRSTRAAELGATRSRGRRARRARAAARGPAPWPCGG